MSVHFQLMPIEGSPGARCISMSIGLGSGGPRSKDGGAEGLHNGLHQSGGCMAR